MILLKAKDVFCPHCHSCDMTWDDHTWVNYHIGIYDCQQCLKSTSEKDILDWEQLVQKFCKLYNVKDNQSAEKILINSNYDFKTASQQLLKDQ